MLPDWLEDAYKLLSAVYMVVMIFHYVCFYARPLVAKKKAD